MTIGESIKRAKERGLNDLQILQEIMKQNPQKGKSLEEAMKSGKTPTQILEEITKQQNAPLQKFSPVASPIPSQKQAVPPPPDDDMKKIEEARKRIEALQQSTEQRGGQGTITPPPIKPLVGQSVSVKKVVSPDPGAEALVRSKAEQVRNNLLSRLKTKKEFFPSPSKGPSVIPPKTAPQQPTKAFYPLPPKPSPREKLWARLLMACFILVVLAALATFWYFYLFPPEAELGCQGNEDCPEGYSCATNGVCTERPTTQCDSDSDCPADKLCGPDKTCIQKPIVPIVIPSLFVAEKERTIIISSPEELRSLIQQIVQESEDADQFKRIIIKDSKENKSLNLKEFIDGMLIRVPPEIYQKINEDNFTLFSFSQMEGNRIGFVTKIETQEGFSSLMRTEEPALKEDFKSLLTLMAGDVAPATFYFRNANETPGYSGYNFRYQTIAKNDFGITYLISDEYFVFTTSWKSMNRIIEKLQIATAPIELANDLKFGDSGYDVKLLQTWLSQDASVYPQGLKTGKFASLTRAAVTRFQEKYASDILAPQGLSRGTGIVDLYTRIKLNELYGRSGVLPIKPEITSDLRYGDHGDQVKLLQSWLKEDRVVYPEGIISGWFGPLTRAAVTRFQEKYASDILAPQGLSRGTGIVDAKTRIKLNDLYGEKTQ